MEALMKKSLRYGVWFRKTGRKALEAAGQFLRRIPAGSQGSLKANSSSTS